MAAGWHGNMRRRSEAMNSQRWVRSGTVWPAEAYTTDDDWTLVGDGGETLAQIFDAGRDDGVQDYTGRWRNFRPGGSISGSAIDGRAAKRECERRVVDRK
jgi:hypothetical protein